MRFTVTLIFLYSLASCKVTDKLTTCSTKASIVDLSNLDGCGLVLQLQDDTRLLAVNIIDYDLTPEQKVFIDFKPSDQMSTCMATTKIVELTCVLPRPQIICPSMQSIPPNSWQQRRIDQLNPQMVSQYKIDKSYIYRYQIDQEFRWYDCFGNLICTGSDETACSFTADQLSNKTDLWITHR